MTRHLPEKDRRQQILGAARRCFIENGYHPSRMDDIAKAAELSKGGVYFHFKSKREVFDCLLEEEFTRSMGFLKGVASSQAPFLEKMQTLGGYYLEYFQSAPDAPRFFVVMGEMALRDAELQTKLREMQTAYIEEMSRLLQQGMQEGLLREVDAIAASTLIKAMMDGVEGLSAMNLGIELPTLLSAGLDLLMRGLVRS